MSDMENDNGAAVMEDEMMEMEMEKDWTLEERDLVTIDWKDNLAMANSFYMLVVGYYIYNDYYNMVRYDARLPWRQESNLNRL